MRGRNQALAASGTRPRRVKTKPNLAPLAAMRMSIGNVSVRPTPTAAPLIAAIDGLRQSKMASMKLPPSRGLPASPNRSVAGLPPKLSAPPEMSAPAQKCLPAPVTTTTRTASSLSARRNAAASSRPICAV